MQAALFHVMVFAKLLQLHATPFFLAASKKTGGFELSEEDYRCGIMRSQHPPHCNGGQQQGLPPRCVLAYWRALASTGSCG